MNIKDVHVILDQSQSRISYVHLCKNTNVIYSPVGEYKGCHIILDQSQRRISYVHLGKNTNPLYSPTGEYLSFIDPERGGFIEIFPEVMIFPEGW